MKNILSTNSNNWPALIARLALGITVFAHGAQKLFGWFGGYGFSGTMGFLTGQMHLPTFLAVLVILIESIGSLMLIFGVLTRVAALGIIGNFLGALFTVHIGNGFFMNWGMQANKGEGFEYFILLLALAFISLIAGGGKASVDAALTSSATKNEIKPETYRTV